MSLEDPRDPGHLRMSLEDPRDPEHLQMSLEDPRDPGHLQMSLEDPRDPGHLPMSLEDPTRICMDQSRIRGSHRQAPIASQSCIGTKEPESLLEILRSCKSAEKYPKYSIISGLLNERYLR
jgi:hypothetical protein